MLIIMMIIMVMILLQLLTIVLIKRIIYIYICATGEIRTTAFLTALFTFRLEIGVGVCIT